MRMCRSIVELQPVFGTMKKLIILVALLVAVAVVHAAPASDETGALERVKRENTGCEGPDSDKPKDSLREKRHASGKTPPMPKQFPMDTPQEMMSNAANMAPGPMQDMMQGAVSMMPMGR